MSNKALVAGVGMVKFAKPGAHEPYPKMAATAVRSALADAGLAASDLQIAYAGYIYGDSACGQRALFEVEGIGDMPVFNVNNNCSSGSTALYLARQAVESGQADCALALGFEEMQPGALVSHWEDRARPGEIHYDLLTKFRGGNLAEGPGALCLFGNAGADYLETYGAKPELFAKIAVKTRTHAARNPYALFTKPLTVDEVMAAPLVYPPMLTKLMCCPPTCGAAAAIVVSPAFARARGIKRLIRIAGQGMSSDVPNSFKNARDVVGRAMAISAAGKAFAAASIGPEDVDVVELHDCFTTNEVVAYEALGLCPEGGATKLVDDGDNTYGGKYVVNPSGGLMSKGHPIGATGLAQCFELVTQLRGEAQARQVSEARVALQHNVGIPGAAVVTVYEQA